MKELKFEQVEDVNGGILFGPLISVITATIAAYDASQQVGKGFEKGYNETKADLKEKNGWN
jgi:hypothetical protein